MMQQDMINKTSTDLGNKSSMATAQVAETKDVITLKMAIKKKQFWHIYIMLFCSGFYGMYMAAVYKNYGSVYCDFSDSTLTLAGSLGASCNGISRIFWAPLADKLGFKRVYFVLLCIQILISGTTHFVCNFNSVMYVIWVCLSYWCLGGQFAMAPPLVVKMFGPEYGGLIYSLMFSAFSFSSLAGFLVSNYLIQIIGDDALFYIAAGLSCVSLILLVFFTEEKLYKHRSSIAK